MLKSSFNVDFSHYKETVVNRRVSCRMAINHGEKKDYVEFVRGHPNELEALFKRMAEALGGSVSFESKEGDGTTFIVRFSYKG